MVKLTMNGMEMEVPSNYTVLEAAREAGIHIPTLCFLKYLNEVGA
jgi:NADH dehydrogenase/NADH:ubiquinone oxidoreductase subunit G